MGAALMLPLLDAGMISVGTASALPALGSVIGAAGLGMSAIGSIAQGQAQSSADKYNAQIAQNNAQIAKQNANFAGEEGNVNAGNESMKTRAQVGGIKAAQAANGIDVNSGSALDVRSSAAELGELDAITVRSNAARQAYGDRTQAAGDQAQAQLDKQAAGYASEAGYTNAATSLLGGAAGGANSGMWNSWMNNSSSTLPTITNAQANGGGLL